MPVASRYQLLCRQIRLKPRRLTQQLTQNLKSVPYLTTKCPKFWEIQHVNMGLCKSWTVDCILDCSLIKMALMKGIGLWTPVDHPKKSIMMIKLVFKSIQSYHGPKTTSVHFKPQHPQGKWGSTKYSVIAMLALTHIQARLV